MPRSLPYANRAGLMDITAFTKVEISGTGATAFLDGLVANPLAEQNWRVVFDPSFESARTDRAGNNGFEKGG